MTITCPKCHSDNPDDTLFCGKCGTQFPSPDEVEVTETIEAPKEELTRGSTLADRYEIIEELGKGGMGRVYRVEDTKLKQEVALKLIKPEIAKDKKTIERFRNELKLAREIAHRNVCRMYDLNEEKGAHYITMEYVRGEDLRGLIRRIGQLPIGKSISIANQVCEGLAEAHRLGVIHRDLKSNNIMIDKEGNVRIMDFGIARSLEAKGITGAGVIIGTPEYMSPEQVEGKETDQRSDIYSLGIILYEMVTGRVPFEGDTPFTVGVKHKSEIPRNPKEINAQVTDDLNNVILKCLEKDKDKRYQSAGEVRSELTNIEQGMPTTERVIPERKPLTSREITVTFGLRKLFIPALVFIGIVIIGVLIWQLLPRKEVIPLAPSGKPALAVMYFKNNTGDENLDHWRSALSELLISDLTQSKHIGVLSSDRLFSILRKLNLLESRSYATEDLREVAVQGRVSHILQGVMTKAGENFRINITIQDASTGELIGSETAEGEGQESFHLMVDELTPKIKANFELKAEEIASDIDLNVGTITTSSPEAYKYYSEGRKYHDTGEFKKSISLMERALEIDSEFALAYRSMAMSYSNLGYGSKRKELLKKAFELKDRLSTGERYLIQGEYYRESEKTYDIAIEAYNELLDLYPTHRTGNVNSGLLYSNLEEWDKAIERYEALIQDKDESYYAYVNAADAYMAKGMYDKATEILEFYLNNFSDSAIIHGYLAFNYYCQGKNDLALVEADKAFSLAPTDYFNFMAKGDIYWYTEDFVKAEKEYQKLLESDEKAAQLNGRALLKALYLMQGKFEESQEQVKQGLELAEKIGETGWEGSFHFFLGYSYLRTGNPEEALREFDKIWSMAIEEGRLRRQRGALYWRGITYLKMGSIDKAQEVAEELKEMIENAMNRKEIRSYYHLMGCIDLERENFSQAIESFNKAISFLPFQSLEYDNHALFIDSLALAYYRSGNLEKALEEYERITILTTGRKHYGDIYTKSFYMLGKIYEQQGDTAKAIEHYKKFLELWKDADPGIAEVDDARERLAGLKN
jgi:serine/threonine protein kinase/predicted Zn-dependent protease